MTVLNLQMVREREQKRSDIKNLEEKCVKLEDKVSPSFRQDPASRRGYAVHRPEPKNPKTQAPR
ncbi:hypothetical protein N7537_010176 [Penicillium hordei]|uniref:Uncharacterized protein n=1 Tax=Penicillium hordei TaxID=40994 RepID=A0AAD6DUC0_9EURO|nr:uncharacterized protein N7537_010176 [Penicillium hordei]KAJ5593272.1 hypothetical protein N7537_010176 [Penicillium hordei]